MFNNLEEKIRERREIRSQIKAVSEKSGRSFSEIKASMNKALNEYGITFEEYDRMKLYKVPDDKLKAEYDERMLRKKRREECIQMIMEYRGCTRGAAARQLNADRKRLDVGYLLYRRNRLFELSPEEQEERLRDIRESHEYRSAADKQKKADYMQRIMNETGWDLPQAQDAIREARRNCGAGLIDYYAFRLWEVDPEDQRTYFTQKLSNSITDRFDISEINTDILRNKELSCITFKDFMRRPWAINRDMTFDEFRDKFASESKIMYKPLDGHGGSGILMLDLNEDNLRDTYDEIVGMRRGVVEGYVRQHPDMNRLYPGAVNTVRVVTGSGKKNGTDIPEDFFDIAYVALRVGRGNAYVDNFSKGGLVAGVDLATGRVDTPGVSVYGDAHEQHPDTGTAFRGFQIPMYEEVLDFVREAGKLIDGYIGWDIAVSETGPMLIEANTNPGNRILQMPYAADRIGARHIMKKYEGKDVLKDSDDE